MKRLEILREMIYASWPLVAGVVFALVVLGVWNVYANSEYRHERMKKAFEALSTAEKLEHWQERIQKVGASAAYRELDESIHHFGSGRRHTEAHIFGEALYSTEGLQGMATCDSRFTYGCFHSFVLQAVLEEGTVATQKLYEGCKSALGPVSDNCEHGIGHGIMSTFEYNIEGLKKALVICDSLSPPSHIVAGCAGGVFMEYGVRSMVNEGSTDMRPFVLEEVLEPCTSLSEPYLGSCAHWQTQWWISTAPERDDDVEMATKMGAWCKQMPGGERAYILCLEGIARRMISLTNGKPEKTAEFCARVTSDPDYQYKCQVMSAKRFAYYYPLTKAIRACDDLPPAQLATCQERTTAEDKWLLAHNAKYK